MYTSDIDIQPIQVTHLIRRMVGDYGQPDFDDCKQAVDLIRSNAVVREFVSSLLIARERVAQSLKEIANDIRC